MCIADVNLKFKRGLQRGLQGNLNMSRLTVVTMTNKNGFNAAHLGDKSVTLFTLHPIERNKISVGK